MVEWLGLHTAVSWVQSLVMNWVMQFVQRGHPAPRPPNRLQKSIFKALISLTFLKLYINKNYLTSFKLHINNVKQWLKEHELYISHFYYQHVTLKNRQHNSPNDKLEGGQLYFLF